MFVATLPTTTIQKSRESAGEIVHIIHNTPSAMWPRLATHLSFKWAMVSPYFTIDSIKPVSRTTPGRSLPPSFSGEYFGKLPAGWIDTQSRGLKVNKHHIWGKLTCHQGGGVDSTATTYFLLPWLQSWWWYRGLFRCHSCCSWFFAAVSRIKPALTSTAQPAPS